MTVEFYPNTLEYYDLLGSVLVEKFGQICPELLDMLFAKRQPKAMVFATDFCVKCCRHWFYDIEAILCRVGNK